MTLIVFGLAFFLAWIILGPVVDLFDVVMKKRARARWLKAHRAQGAHHPGMESQKPVGMDRHRILDDFFKGLR